MNLSASRLPRPEVTLTKPRHEPAGNSVTGHLKSGLSTGQAQTPGHTPRKAACSLRVHVYGQTGTSLHDFMLLHFSLLKSLSEEQGGWPAEPPACRPVLPPQRPEGPEVPTPAQARSSAFPDVACWIPQGPASVSVSPSAENAAGWLFGSCLCLCPSRSPSVSLRR